MMMGGGGGEGFWGGWDGVLFSRAIMAVWAFFCC